MAGVYAVRLAGVCGTRAVAARAAVAAHCIDGVSHACPQPYRLLHVGQRTVDATAEVIARGLSRATGGDPTPRARGDAAGAALGTSTSDATPAQEPGCGATSADVADGAGAMDGSRDPRSAIRSKWRATQRSWGRIGAGDVVRYDDTVSLAYACGTTPIHACLFTSVLAKVFKYVAISPTPNAPPGVRVWCMWNRTHVGCLVSLQ